MGVKTLPPKGSDRAREHSEKYRTYLASDAWKQRRADMILRAGNRCEECGATDALEVHHWSYEYLGDEPDDDLQVLCSACHIKADADRKEIVANDIEYKRMAGWAKKVYGTYWYANPGESFCWVTFDEWLAKKEGWL